MEAYRLYFKVLKYKFIKIPIMLMIIYLISSLYNLGGVILITCLYGSLYDMTNIEYNSLSIMPNKTEDIVKMRYVSIYLPVIISFAIGIVVNKVVNLNSELIPLTILGVGLIFVNIITPMFYGQGMKRYFDSMSGLLSFFVLMIFVIINLFLGLGINDWILNNQLYINIGILLAVLGSLRLSYKCALNNIYGKISNKKNSSNETKLANLG
ncbi:hypothetical protein ACQPU1_04230 [Clostridium paraputrificum]|uniref:hypothetical protein n=1 Tax=Clostridium TaxID=1485 RepID=UPI003D33E811